MARKTEIWQPPEEFYDALPRGISGNDVNGLNEMSGRRPSPFFWHKPEYHDFGPTQAYVLTKFYAQEDSADIIEAFGFQADGTIKQRGPDPIDLATTQVEKRAEEWAAEIKKFVPLNDGDIVGIAQMRPEWVYEGFEVKEKFVILIGVAHNYENIRHAPSVPGDNRAAVEVGVQYTRGAVAATKLFNFIHSQGHVASCYPGPTADALLMTPAAIAAGMGELGKHGSLIHRELGSSFRLSAVTTDMPLVADQPDVFGADDFCMSCQICTDACPPGAIEDHKKMVRGDEKWYVDFDKCIPYFAHGRGCAACIAVCPWSRPGVAKNLLAKMARRREKDIKN